MTLVKPDQIAQLANSVRLSCRLEATPLDVDKLVGRLNGTLHEVAEADFVAKVEKQGDGFAVSVGPQSPNRRRFSIAHELGHLFLHMGYLIDEPKWERVGTYTDAVYFRFGYSTEEYEANEFAASLLMPAEEFRGVAAKYVHAGGYRMGPIADHFAVSVEAATYRGRWLGMFSWE